VHDADIVAEVLLQMLGERRFARTGATAMPMKMVFIARPSMNRLLLSRL